MNFIRGLRCIRVKFVKDCTHLNFMWQDSMNQLYIHPYELLGLKEEFYIPGYPKKWEF